jgi:cytochrome c oxidase subunit I
MAWPKLNAVAFWMIPVAAAMIWIGFSDTGWTAYPPYSIKSAWSSRRLSVLRALN